MDTPLAGSRIFRLVAQLFVRDLTHVWALYGRGVAVGGRPVSVCACAVCASCHPCALHPRLPPLRPSAMFRPGLEDRSTSRPSPQNSSALVAVACVRRPAERPEKRACPRRAGRRAKANPKGPMIPTPAPPGARSDGEAPRGSLEFHRFSLAYNEHIVCEPARRLRVRPSPEGRVEQALFQPP